MDVIKRIRLLLNRYIRKWLIMAINYNKYKYFQMDLDLLINLLLECSKYKIFNEFYGLNFITINHLFKYSSICKNTD